jgi:integrase
MIPKGFTKLDLSGQDEEPTVPHRAVVASRPTGDATLGARYGGPVFTLAASSVSQAFQLAVDRAGLEAIRFHDLRHEATSGLFERGLNVIELARITGHITLSMLDRYTHLDVQGLVQKLS